MPAPCRWRKGRLPCRRQRGESIANRAMGSSQLLTHLTPSLKDDVDIRFLSLFATRPRTPSLVVRQAGLGRWRQQQHNLQQGCQGGISLLGPPS